MMSVDDSEMLNSITKILYPSIAKQHGTTPSRVERPSAMPLRWHGAAEKWIPLMNYLVTPYTMARESQPIQNLWH